CARHHEWTEWFLYRSSPSTLLPPDLW
nr:immunoglobulin heavy chain junction region [Macaca mulatta]MOW99025.1 immunoglobulin heavy chain junction region [Macaca mulatta]MOW99213.1 immunoglobulin heavy chain junction region [Macaca mulatta]MOW99398.1 immunoglobulin heavy chain junction region [Macaca mulatta]MOW99947.1 immunoglobulin heavy chain junction region [Macaca mulatta]